MQAGAYEEAIGHYARRVASDPNNAESRFDLAEAYYYAGRKAEAAEAYQYALALDKSHFKAACNVSTLFQEIGAPETSVQILAQFLSNNRNHFEATISITSILMTMRRPQEAIRYYEDFLVVCPGDPSATINLMTILFSIGKGKKAAPYIRQWLRLHGTNATAHYAMGLLFFTYVHDFERAAEHLGEAVKLAPGEANFQLTFIKALQCSHRHDEAIEQAALLEGSGLTLGSSRLSRLPAYR